MNKEDRHMSEDRHISEDRHMSEDRHISKNTKQLLELTCKLEPVEFIGTCKILGIELYTQPDKIEELNLDCATVCLDTSLNDSAATSTNNPQSNPETLAHPEVKLTMRSTSSLLEDFITKIEGLNRIQRKNLKRLLKSATRGRK